MYVVTKEMWKLKGVPWKRSIHWYIDNLKHLTNQKLQTISNFNKLVAAWLVSAKDVLQQIWFHLFLMIFFGGRKKFAGNFHGKKFDLSIISANWNIFQKELCKGAFLWGQIVKWHNWKYIVTKFMKIEKYGNFSTIVSRIKWLLAQSTCAIDPYYFKSKIINSIMMHFSLRQMPFTWTTLGWFNFIKNFAHFFISSSST